MRRSNMYFLNSMALERCQAGGRAGSPTTGSRGQLSCFVGLPCLSKQADGGLPEASHEPGFSLKYSVG